MKFFATSFVLISLSMLLCSEAASICGGDSAPSAVQSDDSTASEKSSSDVNEKPEGTAVTDATTSAPKPTKVELSEVKRFFRTVQCTLEKAEPLVEQIEKEVKRFGQSAKRFGEGFIHTISDLVDKLMVHPPSVSFGVGGSVGGNAAADDEAAEVEVVEKVTEAVTEPATEAPAAEAVTVTAKSAVSSSTALPDPIEIFNGVFDENLAENEIALSV